MRDYSKQKSNFCVKSKALDELEIILRDAEYKFLALSYNCEGIMATEEIKNLMSKYGKTSLKEYFLIFGIIP